MSKQAWFCPSCQKHHAPHCDTCPEPVDAISTRQVVVTPYYPAPNLPMPMFPFQEPWMGPSFKINDRTVIVS